MRIVLIGPAYPLRGGIAHYAALLYKNLSQRGHDVRVLSFTRQYPSLFFPGKTQADEGKELIPVDSRPVLDSVNPFSWIRAVCHIKKIRPHLLVFQYWMPFFAPCYAVVSGLARKITGCRSMYVCHNIVPHEAKPGDRLLTLIGLNYVDYFIVQSASVRDDLLRLKPGADYRLVPHPVYDIFPEAVTKSAARKSLRISDEKVILYFGFIRRYKGLQYLISAMPDIWKELPVRLLVCGEFYEGRQEILELIRTLDAKGRISVYDDFVPNEDVARYFCAADAVVLPYTSATQSGIVQIAYNYNRPVIVTDVGGLPEVVIHGTTGFTVPPADPAALAAAVIRFYRENREETFSGNVKKEKKKYTWEQMSEAVEELSRTRADSGPAVRTAPDRTR